jgi:hypothetical protein
MAYFTVETNEEAVKEESSGNYINSSGMYDVILEAMWVDTNDKGARTIGLLVTYNDTIQPIYSAFRLDNNDGSPNFEQRMFNKFLICCGVESLNEPEMADLPIGKGKADKEVPVFTDSELHGVEVTLRIAMEYGKYNGNITEKKKVKGVYRISDKATASEIVNGAEAGKQYEKDTAYAQKDIYRDNLTEAEVTEWVNAGRPKDGGGNTSGSTSFNFGANKPKPKFGKK